MRKFSHKTFIIIFLFALFIRLYKLGSLPFGFHEDEILTGYVGRFILLTGKDLYNNSWPLLYFNKFGDYYIILPMYVKGLSTFIFGVNEFAVRFPSALLGALAVVPVYGLAGIMFHNKKVAQLSALIMAISPWHVVLSRASSEGVMGATLFMTAVYLLLVAAQKNKVLLLIISSILFLVSYFIYHPFRLLTPLVFLPVPFLYGTIRKQKMFMASFIIIVVAFFALTAYIGTTIWGSGRFSQTSIFSELSGVSIKIQELIYDEGTGHILTAKTFHNKVIGYGREFISQYFSYYSPKFLFLEGGKSFAYRIPEQGVYYLTYLLFIIAALLPIKPRGVTMDKKNIPYLFYLLLTLPIPAAMTVLDAPNVHRSVTMTFAISLVLGYGAYKLFFVSYKKIPAIAVVTAFLIIEMVYAWHQYSRHADFFNAIYRNDAQKQLVYYLKDRVSADTPIYMPVQNTMPLYYLFYTNDFDPSYATRFNLDARIDHINNITFMDTDCPSNKFIKEPVSENAILVDSHNCQVDPKFEIVEYVVGRNPLLKYQILRMKPLKAVL